jgi:hypothetical protein
MIAITKVSDVEYTAHASPPHATRDSWETGGPIRLKPLIEALKAQGCHQTDIGDALYAADPDWEKKIETP